MNVYDIIKQDTSNKNSAKKSQASLVLCLFTNVAPSILRLACSLAHVLSIYFTKYVLVPTVDSSVA